MKFQHTKQAKRAISRSLIGNKRAAGKKTAYVAACAVCPNTFETIPSVNKRYCSRKCVGTLNSKRMRGGVPWLNTPETALKISKAKLGKGTGEQHWNWKGGVTNPHIKERSQFRRLLQKKVFERDNYTCQICDQEGGNLQVDHIKKWSEYPKLRFEIDNCRTLCMACHYYITFKRKMPNGIVWGHNLNRRITKLA